MLIILLRKWSHHELKRLSLTYKLNVKLEIEPRPPEIQFTALVV